MKIDSRLKELALLFLKLGLIGFGGPAAHIALMEDEVVGRRRWMSREDFLDLLGATNFIPGPNSTELAIHIGFRRAGWSGLLTAGLCFIIPAVVIVLATAVAYVKFGKLPNVAVFFDGMKPVILAIILHALWKLGRAAIKNSQIFAIGLLTLTFALAGLPEIHTVFLGGALAFLFSLATKYNLKDKKTFLIGLSTGGALSTGEVLLAAGPALSATPITLPALFYFFLKTGSVLFGSGYVLLAFLQIDLVDGYHWLTQKQLLDAVVVGQFTPGPVFTTATFIGYLLAGTKGALLATLGIFLPAFFFVALSAPFLSRIKGSPTLRTLLDGVNVASLALMAVVTWQFSKAIFTDLFNFGVAVVCLGLLARLRINAMWLMPLGGALGLIKYWFT